MQGRNKRHVWQKWCKPWDGPLTTHRRSWRFPNPRRCCRLVAEREISLCLTSYHVWIFAHSYLRPESRTCPSTTTHKKCFGCGVFYPERSSVMIPFPHSDQLHLILPVCSWDYRFNRTPGLVHPQADVPAVWREPVKRQQVVCSLFSCQVMLILMRLLSYKTIICVFSISATPTGSRILTHLLIRRISLLASSLDPGEQMSLAASSRTVSFTDPIC